MMITTRLRNLLTAVVCLMAGVSAQAQFSGSVEQYPTSGWEGSPISFKLSEVATALSTDAVTLGEALATYTAAEAPDPLLFYAVVNGEEVAWESSTTAASNGFWMDANGSPLAYGEGCYFYVSPYVDADNDEMGFNMGQMPNVMTAGEKGEAVLKLKFNDKEVTFALTLNVVARPEYDIPEPATLVEKDLNIVGSAEVTVEQFPFTGWGSDKVTVNIEDAIGKLGIQSGEMLADVLGDILYCTEYNSGDVEEGGGLKKDEVTNESSATAPGFWLRAVQNEVGELTNECCRAAYAQGEDYFYVESFAFDPETNEISCSLGQMPNKLSANDTYFVNCYIIFGDKAYKLTYNLKLIERETEGLEGMTNVGEDFVVVEQAPANDYGTTTFRLDVDAIAAALETEVGSFSYNALDGENSIAPGYTTGGEYGFWFNREGYVVGWDNNASGSNVFYVNPAGQTDYSVMSIGQHPGRLAVGDELKTDLLFISGEKYYTIHLTLNIIEKETDAQDWEIVAKRTVSIQSTVTTSGNYTPEYTPYNLSPETLEEAIGTSTPDVYCLQNDDVIEETGEKYGLYSKYLCTPAPGVWYNKDGRGNGWGNTSYGSSVVGICYSLSSGDFTLFSMPDANQVGDVVRAPMFFLNPENEKMYEIDFVIQFVDEIQSFEEVGSASLVLPVTLNEEEFTIDLAPAAEALGVTVDDLLDENNTYWYGMTADGVYADGQTADNGLAFDLDGGYNPGGSIFFYGIHKEGDEVKGAVAADAQVEADFQVNAQFCLRVDDKQFVYTVLFVSPEIYTGIENVNKNDQKVNNYIYDLSGRQITKPVRGLYIQNGRKVVIK